MKVNDLFSMCIGNLKRRRLRTLLTVLGVVIGTASVVIMTSLGFGMKQLNEDVFATTGSLTEIDVHEPYSFEGTSSRTEPVRLTEDVVSQLSRLDHVKFVAPKISVGVIIRQGVWECNADILGVTPEYMAMMNLKPGGQLPTPDDPQLVIGNMMLARFTNTKTKSSYWETHEIPDIDYSKPLFVIFDTTAYYDSRNPSAENPVKPPKKYMMNVGAEIEGGIENYNQYAMDIYTDIDALKAMLRRIFRKNVIPGQPTTKKGKPYPYFCYNSISVYADNMENVIPLQKQIQELGYEASSNMEWLEQSQKQSDMIRMVLGGIGAVSLLVAAIGIANTMMMSIYERTKEIGIMKVLGCDIHDIRNMFLVESAFIGLMGGTIGLGLSLLISWIANKLDLASTFVGMPGKISIIPWWLGVLSVFFAIVISMTAGLAPAMKAMKLSPLAAIKNE